MNFEKYSSYPVVDMPNRQWPSRTIRNAPIWCSVDLRDGNQALSDPMSVEQKLEMFQLLLELGFKEIEIGFPSAAQVEHDFLRKLIEENRIPEGVTVQALTQARDHLIEKTFQALRGAKKAVVHLYNSTSEAQRRMVFRKNKAEIIEIAVHGAQLLKDYAAKYSEVDVTFEYSPESFTGTELPYALEVCEAVLDVWRPTPEKKVIINLPATVEMSTANVYADRVEWFCNNISRRDSILVSLHTHNDRGTGVAASELALMAGADRVEGTLFGNGERTGNLDITTMALNLFSQGVDPQLDFTNINRVVDVYQRCTGMRVHERHPYAGDLVYTAFSGSHQDAISKGMRHYAKHPSTHWDVPYLPIDPADVGRKYEAIIRINSQSGKGGVAYIMENEFGYKLPRNMHPEFAKTIQRFTDQTGKEILPADIMQCFRQEYLREFSALAMKNCEVQTSSSKQEGHTHVNALMTVHGEEFRFSGDGNGPIDAFSEGLRALIGVKFSISSYEEHALEVGSKSQAAAYIQVETAENDQFFGVGVDPNISIASIKALLSALNRAEAHQALMIQVRQNS
ncbi:MAG: 2-isopropylmalate synthase [SAR324 cluster bacterium]|nr:2-isopropylmalate synthase [SAR324 cluster bacterium]